MAVGELTNEVRTLSTQGQDQIKELKAIRDQIISAKAIANSSPQSRLL